MKPLFAKRSNTQKMDSVYGCIHHFFAMYAKAVSGIHHFFAMYTKAVSRVHNSEIYHPFHSDNPSKTRISQRLYTPTAVWKNGCIHVVPRPVFSQNGGIHVMPRPAFSQNGCIHGMPNTPTFMGVPYPSTNALSLDKSLYPLYSDDLMAANIGRWWGHPEQLFQLLKFPLLIDFFRNLDSQLFTADEERRFSCGRRTDGRRVQNPMFDLF